MLTWKILINPPVAKKGVGRGGGETVGVSVERFRVRRRTRRRRPVNEEEL